MARPLGVETLTVCRAPLTVSARDNSEYRDWANEVQTQVGGCNVQPFILSEKYTAELNSERDYLTVLFKVWAPSGMDIVYTDQVIWRGTRYEVLGFAGQWDHIMGPAHHRSFLLRLRTG